MKRLTICDKSLRTLTFRKEIKEETIREYAELLSNLRVDVIDIGMPGALKYPKILNKLNNSKIACCVNYDLNEIEKAYHYLKPVREKELIVYFPLYSYVNNNNSKIDFQEMEKEIFSIMQFGRKLFPEITFLLDGFFPKSIGLSKQIMKSALKGGASCVGFGSHFGNPSVDEVETSLKYIFEDAEFMEKRFEIGFNNNLGLATANAFCSIEFGANRVSCSINGTNNDVALEELAVLIELKKNLLNVECDIDLEMIYQTSKYLSNCLEIPIPINKPIVGNNIFCVKSGIHQAGILKQNSTYEIFRPSLIGNKEKTQIVIGKHSGRAGLREKLFQFDFFDVTDEQVDIVFDHVKNLASKRNSEIEDSELISIVQELLNCCSDQMSEA